LDLDLYVVWGGEWGWSTDECIIWWWRSSKKKGTVLAVNMGHPVVPSGHCHMVGSVSVGSQPSGNKQDSCTSHVLTSSYYAYRKTSDKPPRRLFEHLTNTPAFNIDRPLFSLSLSLVVTKVWASRVCDFLSVCDCVCACSKTD